MNLRGKLMTDTGGKFWFRSMMMVGYPIPTDGVVGRLLKAQNRHPWPAHLPRMSEVRKRGAAVVTSSTGKWAKTSGMPRWMAPRNDGIRDC